MGDEERVAKQSVLELLRDIKSDKVICMSMKELKPSPRRMLFLSAIFIIIFILTYTNNSVLITIRVKEIINHITTISLTLLMMTFTGYAIFQALVNGKTLETLLKKRDKDISLFKKFNLMFMGLNISYLSIIIISFLLCIILENIPTNWHIQMFSSDVNNIIATSLLSCYLVFVLNAFVEIKSFLYNLYQCFTLHAYSKYINKFE
jgi:hypothetical protein